jgi:putative phage-type endonuclease
MKTILDTLPRAATVDRTLTLGASDAAAVLGLSPYTTPFSVWASKVEPEAERVTSNAMKRGTYLESGVMRWTADELGAEIENGVPLDEPGLVGPAPWLSVRPDGVLHYADKSPELAEIKTSRASNIWGAAGTDQVPEHYLVQVMMQFACVPVERARIGAYLTSDDELRIYDIVRDDELIVSLLDKLDAWWYKHCDPHGPRIAPPLDASEASTVWLKRTFPKDHAPIREADQEEVKLALEYKRLAADLAALQTKADTVKAQLQGIIGDAEGITTPYGKVTWKLQSGATRLDTKALEAAHPDIVANFKKQGEAIRVLRANIKLP